jgi:hypothetical protein
MEFNIWSNRAIYFLVMKKAESYTPRKKNSKFELASIDSVCAAHWHMVP